MRTERVGKRTQTLRFFCDLTLNTHRKTGKKIRNRRQGFFRACACGASVHRNRFFLALALLLDHEGSSR